MFMPLRHLNLETPTRCLSDLEASKLTNEIAQFKLANSNYYIAQSASARHSWMD